jgi:hypothetical protein
LGKVVGLRLVAGRQSRWLWHEAYAAILGREGQGELQDQKEKLHCDKGLARYGYGSIPINTIFRGMNIHLPAILMFTRGTRF